MPNIQPAFNLSLQLLPQADIISTHTLELLGIYSYLPRMEVNHEHTDEKRGPIEALAETWEPLAKFAAELARQIASMGRGGQRGFLKNVEILEAWIRGALLQLAAQIELKPRNRKVRRDREVAVEAAEPAVARTRARRAGFRAIEPDDYERQMLALKRPAFDISQFSSTGGQRRDQRARYLARLEAIGAVLASPELYARRVKRKLAARKKRPPLKLLPVTRMSALPELARLSPTSELGRIVWYNDTS